MGIAKDGNISLRQIREDVGLSASGSAREVAVLHKVLKTGGNVAMSEYRGSIYGMQLTQDKSTLDFAYPWNPKLYNHQVIRFGSNQGSASVNGNKILLTSYQMDFDQGPEMRTEGTVLESGSYRFTAKCYTAGVNNRHETHVCLASNADGYLSGAETIHINSILTGQAREVTFDRIFNLTTDQPYITLIGRAICKTGAYTMNGATSKFYDYKLVKV
jgi:hypothetical protein